MPDTNMRVPPKWKKCLCLRHKHTDSTLHIGSAVWIRHLRLTPTYHIKGTPLLPNGGWPLYYRDGPLEQPLIQLQLRDAQLGKHTCRSRSMSIHETGQQPTGTRQICLKASDKACQIHVHVTDMHARAEPLVQLQLRDAAVQLG